MNIDKLKRGKKIKKSLIPKVKKQINITSQLITNTTDVPFGLIQSYEEFLTIN